MSLVAGTKLGPYEVEPLSRREGPRAKRGGPGAARRNPEERSDEGYAC